MSTDITLPFIQKGDFAAVGAAMLYLRQRGFSIGPMQASEPIAILYGANLCIGKWRTITELQRAVAHGTIEAADMRTGPVTVTIRSRAPAAARLAVTSKAAPLRVAS
jgi:hypothetical protein